MSQTVFYPGPVRARRSNVWVGLLIAFTFAAPCVLCLLGLLIALVPGGGIFRAPILQGNRLPTMRALDWGYSMIDGPVWSPDGRWLAMQVASGFDGARHPEVMTPDGSRRHDLSAWTCGGDHVYDLAWMPDGRLSCITSGPDEGWMCIGAPPFALCQVVPLSQPHFLTGDGSVWSPDGSFVVVAGETLDANGNPEYGGLYVVTAAGVVTQVVHFPDGAGKNGDLYQPAWLPGSSSLLSVVVTPAFGNRVDPSTANVLDVVAITRDTKRPGRLTIGEPRALTRGIAVSARQYAWSPSARWLAVETFDPRQHAGKIELLDTGDPAQSLDVVVMDELTTITYPLWSPDGQTLVVLDESGIQIVPYAIDVGRYLRGKGLDQ